MITLIHEVNPIYWSTLAVYFALQKLSYHEHEYRLEQVEERQDTRPASYGVLRITNTHIALPIWITSKEIILSFRDYTPDIMEMLHEEGVPSLVTECLRKYAPREMFELHLSLSDFCAQTGPQMQNSHNPKRRKEIDWAMAVFFLQEGNSNIAHNAVISCSELTITSVE